MNAHTGRMSVISIILAPIMLPIESSDCFFAIAVIVVTSSGSDVPTAIIVTPIIASETPRPLAMIVPSSTSKSAPTTIPNAPKTNLKIFTKMLLPFTSGFSSSLLSLSELLP